LPSTTTFSCRHVTIEVVTKRQDQGGGFGALQPLATILRNTKQEGLLAPEQPFFFSEIATVVKIATSFMPSGTFRYVHAD
jgi:hypothetical protein